MFSSFGLKMYVSCCYCVVTKKNEPRDRSRHVGNGRVEIRREAWFLWMLLIFGRTNIGISLSLDFLIYEQ